MELLWTEYQIPISQEALPCSSSFKMYNKCARTELAMFSTKFMSNLVIFVVKDDLGRPAARESICWFIREFREANRKLPRKLSSRCRMEEHLPVRAESTIVPERKAKKRRKWLNGNVPKITKSRGWILVYLQDSAKQICNADHFMGLAWPEGGARSTSGFLYPAERPPPHWES